MKKLSPISFLIYMLLVMASVSPAETETQQPPAQPNSAEQEKEDDQADAEEQPDATPMPEEKSGNTGQISPERVALMEEMLGIVNDMTGVLKEVRDNDSADEAAGKIYDLNVRALSVCKKCVATPFKSANEYKALQKKYKRHVDTAFRKMEMEARRIASRNFFNSHALIYAMTIGTAHFYYVQQDNAEGVTIPSRNIAQRADVEEILSKDFIKKTERKPIHRRDFVPFFEVLLDIDKTIGTNRLYGNRPTIDKTPFSTLPKEEYQQLLK